MKKITPIIVLLILTLSCMKSHGQISGTITSYTDKDTYVDADNPTTNYGSSPILISKDMPAYSSDDLISSSLKCVYDIFPLFYILISTFLQ